MREADLLKLTTQVLTKHQESALGLLLDRLRSNSFYSRKLKDFGSSPTPQTFFDMPFTLKQELTLDQQETRPFGSNLTFERSTYTRVCSTSGTSSAPLFWLDTQESWDWMLENWSRIYQAVNVTKEDSIFFAFSFGPFLGFWTAFEAAANLGALVIPSGGLTSVARLQKLIELEASVLCCTPSYALRLALTAQENNIDLRDAKVSRIIVAGECGGSDPYTKHRIQSSWNDARVIDHYGMTEVGPAGYSCPCSPNRLHIMSDRYICEVIDLKTGLLAETGTLGELVLTPLGRVGSPVLRYRTGDLAAVSDVTHCACGTTDLGLEGGILGRCDDMVVVRGVNVFPTSVDRILNDQGVFNYHVDVFEDRGMPEIRVQVEACDGELEERIERALHASLGLRVKVAYSTPQNFPASDGKTKRWTRHTTQPI